MSEAEAEDTSELLCSTVVNSENTPLKPRGAEIKMPSGRVEGTAVKNSWRAQEGAD